jgi:hypothetical protein
MLKFLFETKSFTSHEIFGNIFSLGTRTLRNLPYYRKSTLVVEAIRKRGYDDKGSLRPKEQWLPNFDFTLTETQNSKEKKSDHEQKIIKRILKKFENF